MFRASRCRQRPSVVRTGRLGLLPKVAAVGLGAGLVQLWSGPGSGDLGDHAGVRLGALSAALTPACAALRRIHRHRCQAGGNVVRSRVERRHVRWPHSLHTAEGTARPGEAAALLAGQPIIAVTLVQVGPLDQDLQALRGHPWLHTQRR